jgi:hypothetical protein
VLLGFPLAAVKDLANLAGTWIFITAMLVVLRNPAAGMALPRTTPEVQGSVESDSRFCWGGG